MFHVGEVPRHSFFFKFVGLNLHSTIVILEIVTYGAAAPVASGAALAGGSACCSPAAAGAASAAGSCGKYCIQ